MWALRKLMIDAWLVGVVQSIYSGMRSRVRDRGGYSDEFRVKRGALGFCPKPPALHHRAAGAVS